MLKHAVALLALTLGAPAAHAAPAARTRVGTKAKATPKTKARRRAPKLGAKRIRKGKVPAARLRRVHASTQAPSKRLVGSAKARRPTRLRALATSKVSFPACAASPDRHAPHSVGPTGGQDAAVMGNSYRWPVGATLQIGFLDGSDEARRAVAEMAKQWTEHANLTFDFSLDSPPSNPDILIVFDAAGCTSNLGTTSRYAAEQGRPSMHLCHMDQQIGTDRFRRVVLHEFGHALGLEHEHQSPKANHKWNKQAVYDYYAMYGWEPDYVDQWVFRQISPHSSTSSEYDPDSVMHYSFPAEFTKNGVAFGGMQKLSALDKSFIAEVYPGKKAKPAKRQRQRLLAVRNETGRALDVQAIVQTRSGKKTKWIPTAAAADAPSARVPAGAERVLDGPGRRAKLIARSLDGKHTWTEPTITIAPRGGYLDDQLQTYVVVLEGPPDPAPSQTKRDLYDQASKALSDGKHAEARELFGNFVERFPSDDLVPWARFNIVVAWHEEQRADDALREAYALIVDFPDSDAAPFAWFYGGLAAASEGWCDGARSYFEYAADKQSGLPKDWRAVATDYLDAIESDPEQWCW